MNEWLAGAVLAVCVVFMLRMALPERGRDRLDRSWRSLWRRVRERSSRGRSWFGRRSAPRAGVSEQEAERMAQEAIRRAREGRRSNGRWDGNVFRLRGDKRPPRDKLH